MSTGWNKAAARDKQAAIINLLGNEYWLERNHLAIDPLSDYTPTGK